MSNTHYVRCHANSRASINKWSDMQQKGLPRFTVHFENLNATMYIIDDIIEKDVLLHNGLDIVLVFNDYQNENVEIDVRGLTNQILDIFYFIWVVLSAERSF